MERKAYTLPVMVKNILANAYKDDRMKINQAMEMMEDLNSDNEMSISNIRGYSEEIAQSLWKELMITKESERLLMIDCKRLRNELDEVNNVIR